MSAVPELIVFDVNETLSDMRPMADRFADVGLPPGLAATWFAGVLRDGFALATVGQAAPFRDVAEATFATLATGHELDRSLPDAASHVLSGFFSLDVHPDVAEGVRALSDIGARLVTLTNGATAVAESLLERAGLRDFFERLLTVEDAGVWKPARAAYEYALRECDVPAGRAMLVAVHPWDVHGAAEAGLRTAWIDRQGSPYPPFFRPATHEAPSLVSLAAALSG